MKLSDTYLAMASKDYKARFIAEYCQAVIRYNSLSELLTKRKVNGLIFDLTCSKKLLQCQRRIMIKYIKCLQKRADKERIDLPDYDVIVKGFGSLSPDGTCSTTFI